MKYLVLLSIFLVSSLRAEENSVSKEMVSSILGVINEVPAIGTAPIGLCGNSVAKIDFLECSQAIELDKSIRLNFQKEGYQRQPELDALVKTCFQKRFEKCYPNLKEAIELDEIKTLFNSWKKDPRFRYPSGAGMCHYRAEALSYHLAQLGYKTTTIRIDHSPTLIAMDRDADDKLNGNYDDYHGGHTLVQIMINQNGKTVPYLLDPQYMTEPLPRDKYFIKTMGQVCERKDELEDLTSCNYKERPQNHMAEGHGLFKKNNENDSALNCGWAGSKVETRISIWPAPIHKTDGKIVKTNMGKAPDSFKGKIVTSNTSKELIIEAYESYALTLKEKLDSKTSSLEMFSKMDNMQSGMTEMYEKDKKKQIALSLSLKKIQDKIKLVKKNLENSDN